MVMTTGMISPSWSLADVLALNALQKSMIATPCGPSAVPTGGAGVALPAGIWIFTTAATLLLAMTIPFATFLRAAVHDGRDVPWRARRPGSELGDLAELELDGRLPPEDVDQHLQLQLVGVDLHDLAREVGERPLPHPDALARLVLEAGLAGLDDALAVALGRQERVDLTPAERRRLLAVAALADEP